MSDADDARTTRRRWITLAEGVAVAGVVIGGLGLWNSFDERRSAQAGRAAADAAASRGRTALAIEATPKGDGLALRDATHRIERIAVTFPPVLKIADRSGVGDAAIPADWVRAPLLAITDGGADELEGRLPIALTATWWDGDVERHNRAIYDLVFVTEGRLVGGRALRLKGLARHEAATGGVGRRLDTLWATELGRLAAVR